MSPRLRTVLMALVLSAAAGGWARAGGRLVLSVVDRDTAQPVACRMHLKYEQGKARIPKGAVAWDDHFAVDGSIALDLPAGAYTLEIHRGPEYPVQTGSFRMVDFADDRQQITLGRSVDLADEGWYSADLHVHRKPEEIELLMRAEDLHVVPLLTWWNRTSLWQGPKARPLPPQPLVQFDGDRFYHLLAGEDEREGGALLFFNLDRPLDLGRAQREFPPGLEFALAAREQPGAWIEAEKPFWWDLPIWLAHGAVDSIGIVHNHLQQRTTLDNEAWGRQRDRQRYAGPAGVAHWTQEIYYHVLGCGLRIPPSAGSASGVLKNPVGYNRVYAFVGEELTYQRWWESLAAGQVFVTNGPLLRALVGGRLPGHVFRVAAEGAIELDVNVNLTTRDKLGALEIVKNGEVIHRATLDQFARTGSLPPLRFDESGWFLIRVLGESGDVVRLASTGPYYVEVGEARRISRRSVQFFLDWLDQRRGKPEVPDPAQREALENFRLAAVRYFEDLAAQANAP